MVSSCICHNVAFTEIRRLAREGLSLKQISERTRCCTSCGMCRPYVYVVYTTGATTLPLISSSQGERIEQQMQALLPRIKVEDTDRPADRTT